MHLPIATFDDLLQAAQQQPQPQRLLLVFCAAETAEAEASADGSDVEGGYLKPIMCVDKLPDEIVSFAALCEEAQATGQHWDLFFVASLDGRAGQPPSSADANKPLDAMIAAIHCGNIGSYLAFNGDAELLQLNAN